MGTGKAWLSVASNLQLERMSFKISTRTEKRKAFDFRHQEQLSVRHCSVCHHPNRYITEKLSSVVHTQLKLQSHFRDPNNLSLLRIHLSTVPVQTGEILERQATRAQ